MKEFLEEELRRITSDWDGDFTFEVEPEDVEDDTAYFYVTVRLKHRKVEQSFTTKVVGGPRAYIEMGEGSWCDLDAENFFAHLWFDLVDKCEDRP